jgi:hypothetical protein
MIEKYESEQVRSEHVKGAALADLRSALQGKLSGGLDAQVLVPHPAGTRRRARCDLTAVNHLWNRLRHVRRDTES